MKRTLIASCFSLALFGCGDNSSPTEPRSVISTAHQPIQGGQFDSDHVNVVGMVILTSQGVAMCSGNLIAPNLVLTARHCVSQLPGEYVICGQTQFGTMYSAQNMYFSTEAQLSQNSNWIQGINVTVPSQSTEVCGYDIALVTLSQNIDNVTPLIPRIDVEPQTGEPYTAVGYGQQGASGWGGERMQLGNLSVICGTAACAGISEIASTEFEGDTGVCQGDSGGPALDANGKVIGVVSRGGQGCTVPIYGAVSAWKDLIMQVAVDAANKGGYAPPFWALSGSSDPSAGGAGGAGGVTGTGGEPATGGASAGTGGGAGNPQGQACDGNSQCPTGYQCMGNSPTSGTCFAVCSPQTPCGGGLQCKTTNDPNLNVCVNQANPNGNAQSGSSGSCSVVGEPGRGPVKPVPWLVGFAVALLGSLRRRKH